MQVGEVFLLQHSRSIDTALLGRSIHKVWSKKPSWGPQKYNQNFLCVTHKMCIKNQKGFDNIVVVIIFFKIIPCD